MTDELKRDRRLAHAAVAEHDDFVHAYAAPRGLRAGKPHRRAICVDVGVFAARPARALAAQLAPLAVAACARLAGHAGASAAVVRSVVAMVPTGSLFLPGITLTSTSYAARAYRPVLNRWTIRPD